VRLQASVLLSALALTACGSTVQVQGQSSALDDSAFSGDQATTQQPGQPDGSSLPGRTQQGESALPGTTGMSSGSDPQAPLSSPRAAGPGQVATTAVGPGITPTTIHLGLMYTKDAAAAAAAVGAAGASPGDLRVYYDALIKHINSHGGVAGRKLSPVYYGLDTQSSRGVTGEDAAACAHWTQDNKVFMMSGGRDSLNECAERHGAVTLAYGNETAETFKRFPHYLDPISFRLERVGSLTVESLAKRKYFTGKFGLVTWDDRNYKKAVNDGYLPALKQAGVTPAQIFYAPTPQAYGDLGAANAAIQNAVLQFQTKGIDHVVVQDGPAGVWGGGGLTIQWLNAAESQQYRPRYGMNTYNSPGFQGLPATQQRNMLSVTWSNLTAASDAGWKTNATREACFKIMRDAGVALTTSNQNVAAIICDSLFLFKRVADRLTTLTNDAFIAAAERVGAFPTASVYGASLKPHKHDGGDLVRNGHFDVGCTCVVFDGKPYSPTWWR